MNARHLAVLGITVGAFACKRGDVSTPSQQQATPDAQISNDRIKKLALSCAPQNRAELIVAAGSTASHELRCEAMKPLAELAPGPQVPLSPFTAIGIEPLSRPPARDALVRMLRDQEPWCHIGGGFIFGDQPLAVSPAQIALWVLAEFPVPSLRAEVDRVPTSVRERAIALHEYERLEKLHDSAAVAYVDRFTGDASPAGFERLASFIAAGYPWPPDVQPASAEDVQHVRAHALVALEWLRLLASQAPGDVRYPLDCVQDLKVALRSGLLGDVLLRQFDQFDPEMRRVIMNVFIGTAREGSRPQLERIAAHDPDEKVRDAAEHALEVVDRGGYSASPSPGGGSASP